MRSTTGFLNSSPTGGELLLDPFMGHFNFCSGLFGLVNGPALEAEHRQNKETQHQK